ncbi:MAG: pyridoxal phosphate-dependent aminotransferase [Oscillospiraceae bacterium]|nr:pyridoxal phosphate-dependent aminotransferase [Oscillospiraceae bacterium]
MPMIKKSSKLEHVGYDIRGPVLDLANEMAAEGIEILKLNTGNPAPFGFDAPDSMIHQLIHDIRPSQGYSESKGILPARQAIADYCTKKGMVDVTPNDIYTGNGVSELILLCMQAFVEPGDEILVPAPDYPLWTAAITLCGGKAVYYVCDEQSEWNPDPVDIAAKVTPRTRAIVVINPNNPTGTLYSKDILLQIADIARKHNLVLFSDEIYDRLVMDGHIHHSIAALAPDVFTVTFNGLSKSHLIAGFRAGWISLSGDRAKAKDYLQGINMLASMRLCSNVLAQSVIPVALADEETPASLVRPGGRIYEQREFIWNAVNNIPGLSVVKPKAAFYLFPKIDAKRFNITSDEQFAVDFLREKHVLLTHGSGFHWPEPNHFRIVYLPEMNVLEQLAKRLTDFLTTYRQT